MKPSELSRRILLVTPYTVPDFSGSGINAFYFARFLKQEHQRVTLLTFNRNLKLPGKEFRDGVFIRRITYFNHNLITKVFSLFIIFPAFLIQIMRHQFVFIYGAHIIGYPFIINVSKFLGRKVIFRSLLLGSDDTKTIFKKKNRILHPFYRHMFRRLDLYFSINPVFSERFRAHVGDGVKIITSPQGVDTDTFQPADEVTRKKLREQYDIEHDTFLILSIGFLINRKGYMEIFSVLNDLTFDFRYVLAGEYFFSKGHFLYGKRREASLLRKEGNALLGDKLMLTGPVNHISDYYQLADLVLINSTREGLPNTLLEAMACRKAVLIRDLPGITYIVKHLENGIVYQDVDQMKKWIAELYNKPLLRDDLGREARNYVENSATFQLAWEKIISCL